MLRESSAIRGATEVWSDVASSHGLGFRSGDSGPFLHGELKSGIAFEMAIYSDDEGNYTTLALVRLAQRLAGSLVVRPHTPVTRARARVLPPPRDLPAELTDVFDVRGRPPELARELLGPEVIELVQHFSDRRGELRAQGDEIALVLEGVELAHERVERILDAFDTFGPRVDRGPYRGAP